MFNNFILFNIKLSIYIYTYTNIVFIISPSNPIFIGVEFSSHTIRCTQDSPSKPNLEYGGKSNIAVLAKNHEIPTS